MDQAAVVPGSADTATEFQGMIGRALDLLAAGGPVVVILLMMSVVALAITLLKTWQLYAVRIGDRAPARRAIALYRAGRRQEAFEASARSRNPVARVIALAIGGRLRGDVPETAIREEVARFAADLVESLRSYLRPLEVTATLAPLLGLFGTVLGMIDAFQQLEQAGSRVNPAILSGGIWEALLTTAVGLAVAIPAVAVLNWFERIIDRVAHEMEDGATQLFTPDLAVAASTNRHDPDSSPTQLRSARAAAGE